jgi:hypothetical protein
VGATGLLAATASGASASAGATTPGWRVTQTFSGDFAPAGVEAVSAVSAKDAWVTGSNGTGMLVEQWNGSKWQQVKTPAIPSGDGVTDNALGASAANNVWVFPFFEGGPLIQWAMHWNGGKWTTTVVKNEMIWDTAVSGPSDVWAFGQSSSGKINPSGFTTPYAAHYNGSTWKPYSLPAVVTGVAKISTGDIWTLGNLPSGATIAMHWNGTKWGTLKIPVPAPVNKSPWIASSIAASSATSLWVEEGLQGNRATGTSQAGAVLLHWNGSKWTTVFRNNTWWMYGATPDGHGGFWLTGMKSQSTGFRYIVHYGAGKWTYLAAPAKSGYTTFSPGEYTAIPGTQSFWAIEGLSPTQSNSDPFSLGAVLKYGP